MSEKGLPGTWRSEWLNEDIIEFFRIRSIIYSGRTDYQTVEIVDAYPYGVCLILDGKIQSSVNDEYVYHEALVHPAMITHGSPRRVMIIGGGEGATAREVARWRGVEEILMVEIDREVVEICRKYLPEMSNGVFDDERLKLIIQDGRRQLEASQENSIDVIIVDATDPLEGGPAYLLYTKQFYELAYSRLREGGVLVTQATSPLHNEGSYLSIKHTLSRVFKYVTPIHVYVKSFSSVWGFLVASKVRDCAKLSGDEVNMTLRGAGVSGLRFYSGDTHQALISLAMANDSMLRGSGRVILDEEPEFVR